MHEFDFVDVWIGQRCTLHKSDSEVEVQGRRVRSKTMEQLDTFYRLDK